MTELLRELEAVVGLQTARVQTLGEHAIACARQRAELAALRFVTTHHAEIAEAVNDARITKKSAETLCRIYFEIAAEAVGEEHVRAERDKRIAAMHNSAREVGE